MISRRSLYRSCLPNDLTTQTCDAAQRIRRGGEERWLSSLGEERKKRNAFTGDGTCNRFPTITVKWLHLLAPIVVNTVITGCQYTELEPSQSGGGAQSVTNNSICNRFFLRSLASNANNNKTFYLLILTRSLVPFQGSKSPKDTVDRVVPVAKEDLRE